MTTRMSVSRYGIAAVTAAILAGALLRPAPARAQGAEMDARWTAWLGCWAPTAAQPEGAATVGTGASRLVCVLPAEGTSGVDITTIVDGQVMDRTRIDATGERHESVRDGCSGWESAAWSADGKRVYRRAEYNCAAGVVQRSSGVMSLTPAGEWLDVQGVAAGGAGGVRALRYHGVSDPGAVEARAEIDRAVQGRGLAVSSARLSAAAPLSVDDVVDASRHVDAPVVEAWLVELSEGFALDAKALEKLADARVPSSVIDLMVALSYPKAFTVNLATREGELRPTGDTRAAESVAPTMPGMMIPVGIDWYPFGYYGWNAYAPYGYSPYRYGYGYGWYRADRPVIVVRQPATEPARKRGTLVNGRGYTSGGTGTPSSGATPRARTNSPEPSSGSGSQGRVSPSGSSGGSSAGSSSSGSSSGRTAKPREP